MAIETQIIHKRIPIHAPMNFLTNKRTYDYRIRVAKLRKGYFCIDVRGPAKVLPRSDPATYEFLWYSA